MSLDRLVRKIIMIIIPKAYSLIRQCVKRHHPPNFYGDQVMCLFHLVPNTISFFQVDCVIPGTNHFTTYLLRKTMVRSHSMKYLLCMWCTVDLLVQSHHHSGTHILFHTQHLFLNMKLESLQLFLVKPISDTQPLKICKGESKDNFIS